MTSIDVQLEKHYKAIGDRPGRKDEETLTSWDRNIYYYTRDNRQVKTGDKVTYEDHRKVIEIAINILHKDTQHDIAMCILTHRFFTDYRNKVFAGEGSFIADYSFIIRKVGTLFNPTTSQIITSSIGTKLKEYTTPTLVQINHIVGEVTKVKTPSTSRTLNEWAALFNQGAPESTTYVVAGLKLGA